MSVPDEFTRARAAEWLARISRDVRLAGDMSLVHLDEDGVRPAGMTLADEIWLVASQLDWDVAMSISSASPDEGSCTNQAEPT